MISLVSFSLISCFHFLSRFTPFTFRQIAEGHIEFNISFHCQLLAELITIIIDRLKMIATRPKPPPFSHALIAS